MKSTKSVASALPSSNFHDLVQEVDRRSQPWVCRHARPCAPRGSHPCYDLFFFLNVAPLYLFHGNFCSGDHGPPVAAEDRTGHQGGPGHCPARGRRGLVDVFNQISFLRDHVPFSSSISAKFPQEYFPSQEMSHDDNCQLGKTVSPL